MRYLLLAVVLVATRLDAASQFSFTITSEGEYAGSRSGRITFDEGRWRVDLDRADDEVRAHDAVFEANGERIAVNDANHTWFRFRPGQPVVWTATLFDVYRAAPSRAVKPRIALEGRVVTFAYRALIDMRGTTVGTRVNGRIAVATGAVDSRALPILFHLDSGIAEVTRLLEAELSRIADPWSVVEITITRTFEGGGTPMTQVIRISVENARTVEAVPAMFRVPEGYRFQEPVIATPGGR